MNFNLSPQELEEKRDTITDIEAYAFILEMLGEEVIEALPNEISAHILLNALDVYDEIYTFMSWLHNAMGNVTNEVLIAMLIEMDMFKGLIPNNQES